MARTVDEIMNRELFTARPGDRAGDLLGQLLTLEITGAPVVEVDGRPVGFVSMCDLCRVDNGDAVLTLMSVPVDTISASATIAEAAARMCESGRHHLVCVDEGGRAIGMLGSLDVLRGVSGQPVPHPSAFPHYEPATGLVWSDDTPLDADHARQAPSAPGVFVLVHAAKGRPNRLVWSEAAEDVRARLMELAGSSTSPLRYLGLPGGAIQQGAVWFRWATPPASRAIEATGS